MIHGNPCVQNVQEWRCTQWLRTLMLRRKKIFFTSMGMLIGGMWHGISTAPFIVDIERTCNMSSTLGSHLGKPLSKFWWIVKSMDTLESMQPKISILEKSCYATTPFDVIFSSVMETQRFGQFNLCHLCLPLSYSTSSPIFWFTWFNMESATFEVMIVFLGVFFDSR